MYKDFPTLSVCHFLHTIISKTKKCAAKATHEKCKASIAATQLFAAIQVQKQEDAFLPIQNAPNMAKIFSCVALAILPHIKEKIKKHKIPLTDIEISIKIQANNRLHLTRGPITTPSEFK